LKIYILKGMQIENNFVQIFKPGGVILKSSIIGDNIPQYLGKKTNPKKNIILMSLH